MFHFSDIFRSLCTVVYSVNVTSKCLIYLSFTVPSIKFLKELWITGELVPYDG